MRIAVLVLTGLVVSLIAGTCIPLVDNVQQDRTVGDNLAVSINDPSADETVLEGDIVSIEWTASNLTGAPATLALIAESRDDLSRTTLIDQLEVESTGDSGIHLWDTTGFSGPYSLIARIETAQQSFEEASFGLVTVDSPPLFEFISPVTDLTFESGDSINIRWRGQDTDGTVSIGLDPDTSHSNSNDITIAEEGLPVTIDRETTVWSGYSVEGTEVEGGTYNLFAVASDGVNADVTVNAGVQITVVVEEEPEGVVVDEPAEDDEFVGGGHFDIVYRTNQSVDAIVDVKIDTDETHDNGNEITILSQQFVEADDNPPTLEWDGNDSSGAAVDDGIYRTFVIVDIGGSSTLSAEADGLIFRRSVEDQPLIGMLTPSESETVDPGDSVTIEWRDEDENEAADIRIVVDDDPSTTPDGEIEILTGRDASGDGVQDRYVWQVPSGTLTVGTEYYIIGYIDDDGSGNRSIAPGTIIVRDPTAE